MTWNEQDLQRTEYEDNKSHKNLFQLYISQNQEDLSSRKKNLEAIAPHVSLIPGMDLFISTETCPCNYLTIGTFLKTWYLMCHLSMHSRFHRIKICYTKEVLGQTRLSTTQWKVGHQRPFSTLSLRVIAFVLLVLWQRIFGILICWSGIYTVINLYILPLHRILTFLHVQDNAMNICMHSL